MATLNGLAPWKRSVQVWQEAKRRHFELSVAVDMRSTDGTLAAAEVYADNVIRFDNDQPFCEDVLNELLDISRRDWAFIVSDDEWPSEELWGFAAEAHEEFIYRPLMITPLPDRKREYMPMRTRQPRIFPRESIRWSKGAGIDVLPMMGLPERDIAAVLWHYTLWAPRAEREAKENAHKAAWLANYDRHPWPYPDVSPYRYEDFPNLCEPLSTEVP